jgi:hypothetical protein
MLALRKDGETPSDRKPGRSRATYYILKTAGGPICPSTAFNCIFVRCVVRFVRRVVRFVRRVVRRVVRFVRRVVRRVVRFVRFVRRAIGERSKDPRAVCPRAQKGGKGGKKGGRSPQSIILQGEVM